MSEPFTLGPLMDGADPSLPLREDQPDPEPPTAEAGRMQVAAALREGDPGRDDDIDREDGAPYEAVS